MTKKRIRALGSIDADAVILFNLSGGNPNFFYFTDRDAQGIWFYDFHKAVLLTSEMETPRARSNVKIIRKLDSFISSLPKRVAIDGMHTSFALAQKLRK
ncbi:MAG: hypothetical protein HZB67_02140, partial [Candidatus Aenigmarchaeota archaeon]|nr:hypothetical protein [Candidatus Aenigmarchaeota archaeon]